jgi:beta-RFAP synthase
VGLYGFRYGGLIVEAGKTSAEELAPLVSRAALPDAWRFLLVRPAAGEGLSGEAERQAFERLPPVPPESTARMCQQAMLGLLPAAIEGQFELFSESLHRYGEEAGRCFSPQQEGIYSTALAAATVRELRRLGVVGVGQSSWGPTIFALLPSDQMARQVRAQLVAGPLGGDVTCQIVCVLNEPARIETSDE